MIRQEIINALLNSDNENDFIIYILKVIHNNFDKINGPVSLFADFDFKFLQRIYPKLTFEKKREKDKLFFTTKKDHSILASTFSFYSKKKREFNIGLENGDDGVIINPKVELPEPLDLYPYALCFTDKPEDLYAFMKIVKGKTPVNIYVPRMKLNLVKTLPQWTIKVYDNSISPEFIQERSQNRVLSIYFSDMSLSMSKSMKHVFLSDYQSIIDTLSNYEKIVWTNTNYKELHQYTEHGKSDGLYWYQLKKKLPLFENSVSKKYLDHIIKFGAILPEIRDIIDILDRDTTFGKKLKLLFKAT